MKLELSTSQYGALMDLRGPPEEVHMMIMSADLTANGATLEGSKHDFAELVAFISEDLAEGMVSKKARPLLESVCIAIDPGCVDWLGL